MWKRLTGLLLALTLLVGLLALPAAAAETGEPVATVQALGILNGDQNGNLNLSGNVTRAQFCKMLVAASPYRDTVGGSGGYSLFTDVKSDHWAVEYIKTAVDNGWLLGYLDGSFHPDSSITLEEAATVSLRVLGYTNADLAGSYPAAQLSKFNALGLHAGFSTGQGQAMSRMDCAWLFYNLLATETKDGQIYGQTLGYTLDSTGHVDYGSLVTSETEGPFTVSGTVSLPFDRNSATVYRNGTLADWSQVANYDIYYYNTNLQTVWVYSNRITGTYTAATPSAVAPTSVTVAGNTYAIESSTAAHKLSSQGEYGIGDTVTLLLGMNGGVADVCDVSSAAGSYYGVVTSAEQQSIITSGGDAVVEQTLKVLCTDGVERTFTGSYAYGVGSVVRVDYGQKSVVERQGILALSGKVNSAGTALGNYTLSDQVEILDSSSSGSAVRIYPKRLAGATLERENVLFYHLDSQGKIDRLILRDATGDAEDYVLFTSVFDDVDEKVPSYQGLYTYLRAGQPQSYTSVDWMYHLQVGGGVIEYNKGQVDQMKNISSATLTSLSGAAATVGNRTYTVSDNVQVYVVSDSEYFQVPASSVEDTDRYTLTAWYDDLGYPAGGQVRLIVAREK